MSLVALEAKDAVDAKSKVALRDAGDKLVDTCESCHKIFKPDVPSEGIMHQPITPARLCDKTAGNDPASAAFLSSPIKQTRGVHLGM